MEGKRKLTAPKTAIIVQALLPIWPSVTVDWETEISHSVTSGLTCVSRTTDGPCKRDERGRSVFTCDCLEHQWHAQGIECPSLEHNREGQTGQDLLSVPCKVTL